MGILASAGQFALAFHVAVKVDRGRFSRGGYSSPEPAATRVAIQLIRSDRAMAHGGDKTRRTLLGRPRTDYPVNGPAGRENHPSDSAGG